MRRWLGRRLGEAGLVLGGLLVSLLLLEAILRVWNPFPFRVKGDRIVLPRDLVYSIPLPEAAGGGRITHSKNSLGFRGPEPTDDPRALRVFAVGGSTTECFYLADGADWPARMAAALAPAVPGLWVNNAGLDGHSTFGHRVLLADHLLSLKPAVVLFLVGINDLGIADARGTDRRDMADGLDFSSWRRLGRSLANESEVAGLAFNLYRTWQAREMGVAHSFREAGTMPPPPGLVPMDVVEDQLAEHREKHLPGYERRVRDLARLTLEAGALPVFVTQPLLDAAYPFHARWRSMELYNGVLRDLARAEPRVGLVDLARLMPAHPDFFYDDMHYTTAGARRVGRILAEGLCRTLARHDPEAVTGPCPG